MRIRTAALLASAVAVMTMLSEVAFAADIPGNKNTTAKIPVVPGAINPTSGKFETANDRDWYKIPLKQGKLYAFGFNGASFTTPSFIARLRNPAGNVIASTSVIPEVSDSGIAFKAPSNGTYFIEVQHDGGSIRTNYRIWANPDCSDGFSPQCALIVGVKAKSVLTWLDDQDSFGVTLTAGRTYQLLLDSLDSGMEVSVYDPSNTEVSLSGGSFTAASTGRYVVLVYTFSDNGSVYEIMVSE